MHQENLPQLCWQLGRIMKLFPGPEEVSEDASPVFARAVVGTIFGKRK